MTIILDHLNGWEIALVNPTHEFPRSLLFVGDFLNFLIKETSFFIFDHFSKGLPVFNILQRSITCQILVAIVVPPTFRMLCNVDNF